MDKVGIAARAASNARRLTPEKEGFGDIVGSSYYRWDVSYYRWDVR
jgi:hypothetical protein